MKAATANLYVDSTLAEKKSSIQALINSGADVIMTQELSRDTHQSGLTSWLSGKGWGATTRNSAVTVFWNKATVSKRAESHISVNPGGKPWETGAGGSKSIYKIIMVVEATEKATGQNFVILNQHIVPTIDKNGKLDTSKPIRLSEYRKQRDAWAKAFEKYSANGMPVIGGGDVNLNFGTSAGEDLAKSLRKVGAVIIWDDFPVKVTHGKRTIDWLMATNSRWKGVKVVNLPGSDHDGVIGDIELAPKVAQWDGKSYPGAEAFRLGSKHPAVRILGERLVAHGYKGYKVGPGIPMGQADLDGVIWFKRLQGWSGGETVGQATWDLLLAGPSTPPKPPVVTTGPLVAYYPPADHTAQWFPSIAGGADFNKVEKLLLHTTEGNGWHNYAASGFGPHLTYYPGKGWRQHIPLTVSATALSDPSSTPVRENRDFVIQVEVVGFAKDAPNWSEETCKAIGELARFLHENGGLDLVSTVKWVTYNDAYYDRGKQRLSSSQYDAYRGILGHQHASGNDHADPGLVPIGKILAYALGTAEKPGTDPEPTPPVDPTPEPAPEAPEPEKPTYPFVPVVAAKPIDGGEVTTGFKVAGPWAWGKHPGQDWNLVGREDLGMPARSTVEGHVIYAGMNGGWGRDYGGQVIVQDATGARTAMCHLGSIAALRPGDYVLAGQEVGRVGSTGNSTGPHVHVETRVAPYGYGDSGVVAPRYDAIRPTSRVIRLRDLRTGQPPSASAYWATLALNAVSLRGGANLRLTGQWTSAHIAEVKKLQAQKFADAADGELGPLQASGLVGLAKLADITIVP